MTEIQKISFDCSTPYFQKLEKSAATIGFLISFFLWIFGLVFFSCLNLHKLGEYSIIIAIIVYSFACIFAYSPIHHFLLKSFKIPTLQIEFLTHQIEITSKENNAKQGIFNNISISHEEISRIELLLYSHIAIEKNIEINIFTSSMKYTFVCFISSNEELFLFASVLNSLYAKRIQITEKDADGNTLFLLQKTSSKDMQDAHYIALINQIGIKTADDE